jgi:hypothetical protein
MRAPFLALDILVRLIKDEQNRGHFDFFFTRMDGRGEGLPFG